MTSPLDSLLNRLEELKVPDCGDSSCEFSRSKKGMRTNGGCRCVERGGDFLILKKYFRAIHTATPSLIQIIRKMEAALKSCSIFLDERETAKTALEEIQKLAEDLS